MILIHVTVKPYKNKLINFYDTFMLLVLVLVISLQIIETYRGFSSNAALAIAFVLVILPLLIFVFIVVCLHIEDIKKFINYCITAIKPPKIAETTNNDVEMHQYHDDGVVVHQRLSEKSTTVV